MQAVAGGGAGTKAMAKGQGAKKQKVMTPLAGPTVHLASLHLRTSKKNACRCISYIVHVRGCLLELLVWDSSAHRVRSPAGGKATARFSTDVKEFWQIPDNYKRSMLSYIAEVECWA
jgi:hypothetical protein